MSNRTHLTTWVTRESKVRFAELARAQGISESALLRRVVESTIAAVGGSAPPPIVPVNPVPGHGRISVRLRGDDLLLLRERAQAREMPTSTYVSLLVRSHLRALTPLPTVEVKALKCLVAELSAIGRNINQIARAVNNQQWPGGPTLQNLKSIMRALWITRDYTRDLIKANLASWDAGYEKTGH